MILHTGINRRGVCVFIHFIQLFVATSVLHCGSLILPVGFSSVGM